jgi:hypothetical protein
MEKKEEKQSIQPFENSSKYLPFPQIVLNNFIGGISWALGATVGLSLIIAILTLIIQNVNFNLIPVIGSFISNVINFVLANNPNFKK